MAEEEKKDVMTANEINDAELHRDAETVKEETEEVQEVEGRSPVEEANRMRRIQTIVTVAAILVAAFFVFRGFSGDEGFYIQIPGKEGIAWECSEYDENYVKMLSSGMEDGDYVCRLEGLSEGETEVQVYSFEEKMPSVHLEERVYHLLVMEDGRIIQKSVERTVLQD